MDKIREINEKVWNELIAEGYTIAHSKGKDDWSMKFTITNKEGKSIIFTEDIWHNLYGETPEVHYTQTKRNIVERF